LEGNVPDKAVEYHHIRVEKENGVARLVFSKPPLNVMNIEMMNEITMALEMIGREKDLKVMVVEAEGKAFSAGVDVADHTEDKMEEMLTVFHNIFFALRTFQQPIVGVVDGPALGGGCEIITYCDMVIASDRATFGQPEITVGVFPPVAVVALPKLIGKRKTYELVLTGKIVDAEEALRMGLINKVVPHAELDEEVDAFLEGIRKQSAIVLRMTKRAIFETLGLGFEEGVQVAERLYIDFLMKTEDAREGLQAFLERRKPSWKNR
jgi:cyclohexa-1,5-dienecarbonyl-CoA hydratase